MVAGDWPTALAPMQDVTGLPFMKVVARRGSPDFFFTEFIRVHAHSRVDPGILSSITENPGGRPVFAQLIGENLEDLRRVAREVNAQPIAGIDLNLGCPAPRVYRKNVGGGLLREPDKIRRILDALSEEATSLLSVKMRIGFEDDCFFGDILEIIEESAVGLVSVHARTVKGGYEADPSYPHACPGRREPFLSGSSERERGHLSGRSSPAGEDRGPWRHDRTLGHSQPMDFQADQGNAVRFASLPAQDGRLVRVLRGSLQGSGQARHIQKGHVGRMKKFLNFVGLSVDAGGEFLYAMRRSRTRDELFLVCERFMISEGREEMDFPLEPFEGLASRKGKPVPKRGRA